MIFTVFFPVLCHPLMDSCYRYVKHYQNRPAIGPEIVRIVNAETGNNDRKCFCISNQ